MRAKRHVVFVVARRVYTYLYSCASVMQWRGCWTGFDQLFVEGNGGNVGWTVVAMSVSMGTLIGFKSLTNVLATPCVLLLDSLDACYNIPTRYRIMVSHRWLPIFLLCIIIEYLLLQYFKHY